MKAENQALAEFRGTSYTAAQIAVALGIKRQAVQWHLRGVIPAWTKVVKGNETCAWEIAQLPENLQARIKEKAQQQNFRSAADFLSAPRKQWQPDLPIDQISDEDVQTASLLRKALQSSLKQQHDSRITSSELEALGVEEYRRALGRSITARHWRSLFKRTIERDNGFEQWDRIEIYLPDRVKRKATAAGVIGSALDRSLSSENDFQDLAQYIEGCSNPYKPSAAERTGLWALALKKYDLLIRAGSPEKSAGRRLRAFLFARARFLSPSRNGLRMAFERKLEAWQHDHPDSIEDGRKSNGDRANYPREDIRRVRHSAVLKNGGRIDAAWREEYRHLTEYTRQRHPQSRKCPRTFYERVNRVKVDALLARVQGRRTLRKLVGGVTRDAENVHTMDRWAADDWTSNIEVIFVNRDGSVSLIQPQIITVMDFASRKWVGWAFSNDKAPTARLVNKAIKDAFLRHDVPHKLFLENGFVFGKSLNVNGKVDGQGRTIVAGLAKYGCAIHHFDKMSPTSKGELEKSFDLAQRLMERHPGYTGRLQMLDASEDFKREQRLIRSGKVDASKYRYTFEQFARVLSDIAEQYNAAPQHGHLRGLSPNEAFEALKDPANPPIKFTNELLWMLSNEHYRVPVGAGGVTVRHYGQKIQVRGGRLPDYIGEELWALVDDDDDSMVTFMSLDYGEVFTVAACQRPAAYESQIITSSSILAAELGKIHEHMRAVGSELKDLSKEFGNPRRELLQKYSVPRPSSGVLSDDDGRRAIVNPQLTQSAEEMQAQRQAIRSDQEQNARRGTDNKRKAARIGIPSVMADSDEQTSRALELLNSGSREIETSEPKIEL